MKVFDARKAAVCGELESVWICQQANSLGQAALITDGSAKCQQTDLSLHVRKQSA